MLATITLNPERTDETLIELFEDRAMQNDGLTKAWGGVNFKTGKPYIVWTPPKGIPRWSVKQERFFKVFLLAAHIHFSLTGEMEYAPEKAYDAFKVVFPPEFYPFGTEQVLPDFATL
jgi:hypothetical protein